MISTLKRLQASESGFLLPGVLSFIIAAVVFSSAVLMVIMNNFFVVGNSVVSQQAFNIAEAGANYYLWHLSHNGADYQDGTGAPATQGTYGYGPYVHNYVDSNAKTTGTYTLWVKPASVGSTIVTVRSVGKTTGSNITRTVVVQIGAKSFASYGLVSDSALWFGNTESADGPVFSNQGVRMDGSSSDTVAAAGATYVPPSNLGGDGSTSHPGVWCSSSVTAPVNCNNRDKTNWTYPQNSVDFNQVSTSLCKLKKVALADDTSTASIATQSTACTQTPTTRTAAYIPQYASSYTTTRGYLIQLNSNSTYSLYKVNSVNDLLTPYSSALSTTLVATNIALPPSGVIFAEDNVWVRSNGNFNGRVTIAAGRLATSYNANITIADDVTYGAKDGSDSIGMVSEGDIDLAPYAPPSAGSFNFEVDAALLAGTGSVIYPGTYDSSNNRCTRGWTSANQTFSFYGSIASRDTWTWTWLQGGSACGDAAYDASNGYISGIEHNTTQYDYNLLYAPPPSYPVTGGYGVLSWREVLTKP